MVKYNCLLALDRVTDKALGVPQPGDLVLGGPLLSPMTDAGQAGGLS